MSIGFKIAMAQNHLNSLLKFRMDCVQAGTAKAEDYADLDAQIADVRGQLAALEAQLND